MNRNSMWWTSVLAIPYDTLHQDIKGWVWMEIVGDGLVY